MANKTGSRQRLLATLEILREHTDDQTHLTGEQIKEHLQKQYEIDSDRRSIREDIKVLSEFGYAEDTSKYAKRDERGAYYVAHPFEDWELKVLIDGVAQTEHFKAETLNHMIDRIIQLTGPAGRELLTDNRPALNDDAPNSDFYLCRNLDDLLNAIKAKKKVRLSYSKLDANKNHRLRMRGYMKSIHMSLRKEEPSTICSLSKTGINNYGLLELTALEKLRYWKKREFRQKSCQLEI